MNTLKSKLMLLAISLLPMIVLGDMPGPIYIHRLRRIGVDVLPDGNKFESINEECVIIVAVLLLMSIGLIVLFKRRMISLLFIWNRCKWFVCKMNRRYMVLMVLLGGFCWVIHYFGHRAMQEMSVLSLEWRKIYVNEPGWYYSDGVPDSERKAVMAKITDDLIADLQKAIDEDGVAVWYPMNARQVSKLMEDAVLKALIYRKELAERCHGIPVEWLANRLRLPIKRHEKNPAVMEGGLYSSLDGEVYVDERHKPVKSVRLVSVRLKEAVNRADVETVRKLIEQNEAELKKADMTFDDIFRRFDGSSRQMEIVRLLDEKGFKLPFRTVDQVEDPSCKSEETVVKPQNKPVGRSRRDRRGAFGERTLPGFTTASEGYSSLVNGEDFRIDKGTHVNCRETPSFGNDRSHKIYEEMERHMREVREFHENRKPGERFDHDRLRQIHDEHHRRMRELHNGM